MLFDRGGEPGSHACNVKDQTSIEDLYRKYATMVVRRARTLLGDEQSANDAMQEVFVRALRAGASFRGEASPVTWLYRVTTNYCLNQIRDTARRRELLERQGPATDAGPDRAQEDRFAVARLLETLRDDLQEIAVYYFIDQMNQDEIAEILGVSRRTVGNRLQEFRQSAEHVFKDVLEPAR